MQWRRTFSVRAFLLTGEERECFCTSAWQLDREPSRPLFCWRILTLCWATAVTLWSLCSFWGTIDKWLIYMTHWGITFILLQAAFGVWIGIAARREMLYDDSGFGLPWYVQAYWALYNISVPIAFLITIFYWGLLYGSDALVNYAPNKLLDVSLHAVNSVVMLVELAVAGQPSRLLHFYQPGAVGLAYLLFSLFYYLAGGTDPFGNSWVYPVVDWSKPGPTGVVLTLTAVSLCLMHLLAVGLAAARDTLARRLLPFPAPSQGHNTNGIHNQGYIA